MSMIEITELHKHYKDVKAVNGISFTVREGEIFGFLGPNGAMTLLVYLHREEVLEAFFATVLRGLGGEQGILTEISLMSFLTVGLITYVLLPWPLSI